MNNLVEEEGGKQFEILAVNRYEVEENAVFLDYEPTALSASIQKYSQSKFQLRLSLAKNLRTIEQILLNTNKKSFIALLESLSIDHEEMQTELLAYLTAKSHSSMPVEYSLMVLGALKNLVNGTHLEIKEESCKIIGDIAHTLESAHVDEIVEFANELAKSENEENKIVAIMLLARLTRDLPVDKREAVFLKQFVNIYSGSSVRVKKEVILELGHISEHLTHKFVDQEIIRSFFLRESKENAWGIRKACVEVSVELLVKAKTTKEELSNTLLGLLKDGNKFVRIAAHKILPQFLANYKDRNPPMGLFDVYLTLIDLDINNQVSKQNQIIQKISYYFPGVLKVVGSTKWPKLHNLFNRLLHNRSEEVKRPLADSLHIIAQIIGPNYSREYLFSALDYILREPADNIKLCAIRNLAKFVEQFEAQTKENLIDVFLVLQKDPKKWRVRYLISNQLKYLSEIYDADANFKYLFPISLKLCNDQVSEVRRCASQQIIFVVNQLKKDEIVYKMALQSILGYAASQKYLQRQTFCHMLQSIYNNTPNFHQIFHETILTLCKDAVILVRIALAIAIGSILRNGSNGKKGPEQTQKNMEEFKDCIDILTDMQEVGEQLDDLLVIGGLVDQENVNG